MDQKSPPLLTYVKVIRTLEAMPFKLFFLPSYERCLKGLGSRERSAAGLVVSALLEYFQSGVPASGEPYIAQIGPRSYRLVFKKLRGNIWEAYLEGQVRILTRLEHDKHFLVCVGNHDDVKRFLKEQ